MRLSIVILVARLVPTRLCFGFSTTSKFASSNIGSAPREKLKHLLNQAKMELSDMNVQVLSGPGFCNEVYKLQPKQPLKGGQRHSLIAKLFSPLAKIRMDPSVEVGHVDMLASNLQLGPRLRAASNDGILMECVSGEDLKESAIHNDEGGDLCRNIAKLVAQFHAMESLTTDRPNMLWYSIDAMLSLCKMTQCVQTESTHWSVPKLEDEIKRLRDCIVELDLPLVLGHGDLKPANCLVSTQLSDMRLIDFELSGVHNRGFDVAKLFRTDHPTLHTETNLQIFVEAYVKEKNSLDTTDFCAEGDLFLLPLESKIMEPLSWLEAAIFFLCSASMVPSHEKEWKSYTYDRLKSYERAKIGFEDIVSIYKHL